MLILSNPQSSFEILLSGAVAANQLPVTVNWVDTKLSDQSVSDIIGYDTISADTTVVTIAPAPATGMRRTLKSVDIYNADTTGATVTVRKNNGTTTRNVVKTLLSPGDTLQYEG